MGVVTKKCYVLLFKSQVFIQLNIERSKQMNKRVKTEQSKHV